MYRWLVLALVVLFALPMSAGAANKECIQKKPADASACNTYLNTVRGTLIPYYRNVHSKNKAVARKWQRRMESHFTGQARKLLNTRTAKWPRGTMKVKYSVKNISFILAGEGRTTVLINIKEKWEVRGPSTPSKKAGKLLYRDVGKFLHQVYLTQDPKTKKWLVTNLL